MYKNIRHNSSARGAIILYVEIVSVLTNELADNTNR